MDLYSYAKARFYERPRPDWKHDTEVAYRRWMDDESEPARDDIIRAIAPGIFYIAYRYANIELGVTREDAFGDGMAYVARALTKFNPDESPLGVASVASYLMTGATFAMRAAVCRVSDRSDVECSLDDYEDPTWLAGLSASERYDGRASVEDVVRGAIASMSPSAQRIATWRLIDDMTWDEVLKHARQMGDTRTTRWGMINHFNKHVRPSIADALRRAGYDEGDA